MVDGERAKGRKEPRKKKKEKKRKKGKGQTKWREKRNMTEGIKM